MTIWEFLWRCGNACYNYGYQIGEAIVRYWW